MKKRILFLMLVITSIMNATAQAPKWVTERPTSEKEYIGIGVANISDDDYMQTASQNALADIASQIATKVENESFMHTIDVDGKSRQLFEDKILNKVAAWIEGAKLKDSYQSDEKYYVYYTLDKKEHKKNSDARRSQAIEKGLDHLNKGRAAEEAMNLSQALLLYGKGLEAVEPWLFMNLSTTQGGRTIDIPTELYNAYINVFSGMAITTNTTNVEGESFKAIRLPIAGCLSRGGVVVPNVKLNAKFVKGSGEVTPSIETDYNGTAEFYITNITSKEPIQEVRITIDESFTEALPQSYKQLLQNQTWPQAKVTVTLTRSATTAFLYLNEQNDLEGIERHAGKILANNHFTLTEDPDAAECFIDLSTTMELGETVKGKYDLNACYCTIVIKIYNNSNQQLLLDYSENRVKVLVPTNKSAEETISMCINEVMKRVKRNLPNKMKKMNM
ncbi:MAG: LPP20 family lipoprotein [Bacteroidaceae bacterium]|nr:LPP20 family lipoprotein [Bacteroidaceae bacterium]